MGFTPALRAARVNRGAPYTPSRSQSATAGPPEDAVAAPPLRTADVHCDGHTSSRPDAPQHPPVLVGKGLVLARGPPPAPGVAGPRGTRSLLRCGWAPPRSAGPAVSWRERVPSTPGAGDGPGARIRPVRATGLVRR